MENFLIEEEKEIYKYIILNNTDNFIIKEVKDNFILQIEQFKENNSIYDNFINDIIYELYDTKYENINELYEKIKYERMKFIETNKIKMSSYNNTINEVKNRIEEIKNNCITNQINEGILSNDYIIEDMTNILTIIEENNYFIQNMENNENNIIKNEFEDQFEEDYDY